MSETYFIKDERKDSFTILDTTCIRDSRLSMKSKGLHTYLMSLPPNWKINLQELRTHFSDGKDSINSAIKELVSFGYIKKQNQVRQQSGQFGNSIFIVYEKPIEEEVNRQESAEQTEETNTIDNSGKLIKSIPFTVSEKPSTVKPVTENPTLINIDKVNNEFSKNLLNTTSTSDTQKIEIVKQTETCSVTTVEEVDLQSIITKILEMFSNHYVFDSQFAYDLFNLQKEFELSDDDFSKYLEYAYQKTKDKKPNSLTNMFYKLAKSQSLMQDFIIQLSEQRKVQKQNEVVCPVCGKVHKKGIETCPVCEYDFVSGDVEYYKSIFTLGSEQKSMFKTELNAILNEKMNYSLSTLVKNKSLSDSFNNRLNALYKKYGVKKQLV